MSIADFQNGFTLGFTSGGTNLLDHLITFKANDEDYQIISVKNGNAVNAPVAEPADDGYNFIGWQHNGEIIKLPFIPTEDIELIVSERPWSDILYEYYKVDKEIYPYILFQYDCQYNRDNITPVGASMKIFFAKQLIKHESAEINNTYYVEIVNYMGNATSGNAFGNAGGVSTATSLEEQDKEINSSNICDFIMQYEKNTPTGEYKSYVLDGNDSSEIDYKHDIYWITNDSTWANTTPVIKQVFIIA